MLAHTKAVASLEEDVNSVKENKEQAQTLIEQFCSERKEKEAIAASVNLRAIDALLPKMQRCYEAAIKLRSIYQETRRIALARFEIECDAVKRAGDVRARRALQRVRKRWIANETSWEDSDRRTLEILKMLRDKTTKAAWAKDGPEAGYWEAASGGERALSDKTWQKRLTAREIQSGLVDAPGDRDAKDVRRLAKKLGILLAEDQRGRKRKPCLPQQRVRICPECLIREVKPRKRLCSFCGFRARVLWPSYMKDKSMETDIIKVADANQIPSGKTSRRGGEAE